MVSGGISGVGVGIVTAGALLVYAGINDLTPLDALRVVAGGRSLPWASGASPAPAPATPSTSGESGLKPDTKAGTGAGGGGGGSW